MSVITQGPITITNVESQHTVPFTKSINIYNDGTEDLRVAFDQLTTASGYTLVPAGTSLTVDDNVTRELNMVSDTASNTTVYLTITAN